MLPPTTIAALLSQTPISEHFPSDLRTSGEQKGAVARQRGRTSLQVLDLVFERMWIQSAGLLDLGKC